MAPRAKTALVALACIAFYLARPRGASLISLLLIHHIHQRLALGEPADVFLDRPDHAAPVLVGPPRDMWRDDDVVELPERVALRKRLGVRHIDARAGQALAVECLHQTVHFVKPAAA